jgi:sugar phosphate isomerase/epimerase
MGKSPLSVQSFCFRNFKDNKKTAELVKEIGLAGIEICKIHCDFADESQHQPCLDTYAAENVRIVSIGVNALTTREANTPIFEFAKKAGLKVMSVNFPLDQQIDETLKTADAMAEEYGIKLGIHNHGGYHWLGNKDALAWVFGKTSPRVGLCLDTAWALDAKFDPMQAIEMFSDRMYTLHLKDFIFNKNRTQEDVVVGTGNIDLPAMEKLLLDVGFTGEAVIEYEGDPAGPVPALKECVVKIKAELSKVLED